MAVSLKSMMLKSNEEPLESSIKVEKSAFPIPSVAIRIFLFAFNKFALLTASVTKSALKDLILFKY